MKEKTKWIRSCHKCNRILYYSTKYTLKSAIDANTNCRGCFSSGESNPFYGKTHSTETIQRLKSISGDIHWNYGNVRSDETKKKISDANTAEGNGNYGKSLTTEHKKKIRLSTINQIEIKKCNGGQMKPNYNVSSIPIIEAKANELGITDLQHAENGGEYHIKELGYWVDGYSKEKNIVIEYDEPHHKRQVDRDAKRQNEIEEYLNCKFIRIIE